MSTYDSEEMLELNPKLKMIQKFPDILQANGDLDRLPSPAIKIQTIQRKVIPKSPSIKFRLVVVCLFVCLCLFNNLFVCFYSFICLFIHLFVCLFDYLCVYSFICLFVCLIVHFHYAMLNGTD